MLCTEISGSPAMKLLFCFLALNFWQFSFFIISIGVWLYKQPFFLNFHKLFMPLGTISVHKLTANGFSEINRGSADDFHIFCHEPKQKWQWLRIWSSVTVSLNMHISCGWRYMCRSNKNFNTDLPFLLCETSSADLLLSRDIEINSKLGGSISVLGIEDLKKKCIFKVAGYICFLNSGSWAYMCCPVEWYKTLNHWTTSLSTAAAKVFMSVGKILNPSIALPTQAIWAAGMRNNYK